MSKLGSSKKRPPEFVYYSRASSATRERLQLLKKAYYVHWFVVHLVITEYYKKKWNRNQLVSVGGNVL